MRHDLMWIFIASVLITSIAAESYVKTKVTNEAHLDSGLEKLDKSRDELGGRNKTGIEKLNKFHVTDSNESKPIAKITPPGLSNKVGKPTKTEETEKNDKEEEEEDEDMEKGDNEDEKKENQKYEEDHEEQEEEDEEEEEEEGEVIHISTSTGALHAVPS
ncbi:hypothetical protein ACTXT7_017624, partial [Hymenolepis weldensis]